MVLAKRLNISMERAVELFYKSKTCDSLHNPDTMLYTLSDEYIADDVLAEYQGL